MEIFDYHRNLRATITDDGTVKNLKGETLGFINASDGACGDANEKFLGEINQDGQAINSSDDVVGKIDLGHGTLRDAIGGHFATIYPGGDVHDGAESYRGRFDNFSFHKLIMAGAYIFFFDQAYIVDGRPSLVTQDAPQHSDNSSAPAPAPAADPWAEVESSSISLAMPAKSQPKVEQFEAISLTLPMPTKPAAPAVTQHAAVTLAPVTLAPITLSAPAAPAAPAKVFKPYRVGDFKAIENATKNQLEIFDCDCDIHDLSIRIEQNGQNVVFKRAGKASDTQRFALPYSLTLDRIKATYQPSKEGGTLTLIMTKPGAGASSGNITGEFINFTVPADAAAADGAKVTMSAGQTSTYFLFKPQGQSRYATEIQGELVNGRDVKFHATVTQTDKGTRTKSTQTFTLPSQVALDHVQVGAGYEVKVFMKKPDGAGSAPAAAAPAVPDADVPIATQL